jgi:hypothetical protein
VFQEYRSSGTVVISLALIVQDHATRLSVSDDLLESSLGGRKRSTTGESRDFGQQPPAKEARDKYTVERGYGVARALETVLLHTQREDKVQNISLVLDISQRRLTLQDLLYRARKIKERLQPALLKHNQDEGILRRLTLLNQVLTRVIDGFEEAFPECRNTPQKPELDDEPELSDEEIGDEGESGSTPPSHTRLRRSSSMMELARGQELEEGDVHRFGSIMRKRNLACVDAELSGQQLLEAILKVDKETLEREVWNKDGLREALHKNIDDSSKAQHSPDIGLNVMGPGNAKEKMEAVERIGLSRKDSDSHSI